MQCDTESNVRYVKGILITICNTAGSRRSYSPGIQIIHDTKRQCKCMGLVVDIIKYKNCPNCLFLVFLICHKTERVNGYH